MRASSRRRPKSRKEIENLSDVAAWLYTDLLLGLAVVFIGGGAFMLNYTKTAEKGSTVQQPLTYQLSCAQVEFSVPESISGTSLDEVAANEIFSASKVSGWTEAKPGVVMIYGTNSDISAANREARRFVDTAVKNAPILKNAKIIPQGDTNSRLNRSEIVVRIFVVYKGQVKDNGCLNN